MDARRLNIVLGSLLAVTISVAGFFIGRSIVTHTPPVAIPPPVRTVGVTDAPRAALPPQVQTVTPSTIAADPPHNPPDAPLAENGSYYGQPNGNGSPKTVHVDGYTRKDGTHVREHYRSAPRSGGGGRR